MLGSIFDDHLEEFVSRYEARIEFNGPNRFVGSSPAAKEVIQRWTRSRLTGPEEEMVIRVEEALRERGISDINKLTYQQLDEIAEELSLERSTNVHQKSDDGEIVVFHGRIKAMLKEAISIAYPYQAGFRLGFSEGQQKSPQSFFTEVVEIRPIMVPVLRRLPNGEVVRAKVDDLHRDTITGVVSTPQGPRAILTTYEYLVDCFLDFTVMVIGDAVPAEWWPKIWIAGMFSGQGGKRSPGWGRFVVTRFERMNETTYYQEALKQQAARKRGKKKAVEETSGEVAAAPAAATSA